MSKLAKPLPITSQPVPNQLGITLADAVARWQVSLQAENRAPRTIHQYMYALDVVTQVIGSLTPLEGIDPTSIDMLVVTLQGREWKPATVSSVERPLRTFLKWCVGRGLVRTSPMDGRKPVTVPVEQVRFPSAVELRAVLATTNSRSRWAFRARRDEAIIRLFASTGLRLAELNGLRLQDVATDTMSAAVTVLGKGRKYRTVPLDDATAAALRTYLTRERPRSPFSGVSDRLWLASKGPMTDSGVAQMVADRGASVGVPLHPHALRHYAIDQMLRVMSEGDVMRITGHTTRAMLDRYAAALGAERADVAFRATFGQRAAL